MRPEIRFARTDDGVHIAYTAVGEGPPLVVAPPGSASVQWVWEDPLASRFFERLADFSHVVFFDKRGTGASDAFVGPPTLEQRVDDIRAVMDANAFERAVVLGLSEGGSMASMFAAAHPHRVTGLITYATIARMVGRPGDTEPFIATEEVIDRMIGELERTFESGGLANAPDFGNPTLANDPDYIRSSQRRHWLSASPSMHMALAKLAKEIDLRPILGAIRVPTLVLHRAGEAFIAPSHGRFIAENVRGARFIELPGVDHFPWVGDAESVIAEIQTFVTGDRPPAPSDHLLATLMVTDLVSSTEHVASVGDKEWKQLLSRHNVIVRDEVERYRGRLVRFTGDGALAMFDGPVRAVRCAKAVTQNVATLGLQARAGLHAGEIQLIGDDITGLAVHIASRVTDLAGPGEVLASSAVRDLSAGSGVGFVDRGAHTLRGVPHDWRIFEASVGASAELMP